MKAEKQNQAVEAQAMRTALISIQNLLEPLENAHEKTQHSSTTFRSAIDSTHLSEQELLKDLDANLKGLQVSLQRLGHRRWSEECAKSFSLWLQDFTGRLSLRVLHVLVESCAVCCCTYEPGSVQIKLSSRLLEAKLERMRELEPEDETYNRRGIRELIDKLFQGLFSLPKLKKIDFGPHLEAIDLKQPEDELEFVDPEDLSVNEIESLSSENSEEEDATPKAEEWKKMLLPRIN